MAWRVIVDDGQRNRGRWTSGGCYRVKMLNIPQTRSHSEEEEEENRGDTCKERWNFGRHPLPAGVNFTLRFYRLAKELTSLRSSCSEQRDDSQTFGEHVCRRILSDSSKSDVIGFSQRLIDIKRHYCEADIVHSTKISDYKNILQKYQRTIV